MKRLFGESDRQHDIVCSNHALSENLHIINEQIESINTKLNACEAQVKKILKEYPERTPLDSRVVAILKRKKLLEKNRDQLYGIQLTLDQANSNRTVLEATLNTFRTLKLNGDVLKENSKRIDADALEVGFTDSNFSRIVLQDFKDDLAELFYEQDSILQTLDFESLVPNYVDPQELEREFLQLACKESEVKHSKGASHESSQATIPSYLPHQFIPTTMCDSSPSIRNGVASKPNLK